MKYQHLMLLLVGMKYRRLRSSMLRAIERGRKPAVDFLNGEIVERGKTHHIETPHNAAIQDMVLRIAQKETTSDMAHIKAIRASTPKST